MQTRTSQKTVTFKRPFVLAGLDEVLPAGDYSVETEEELVDGISYAAYRRTETVLRLHVKSGTSHLTREMNVDTGELEEIGRASCRERVGQDGKSTVVVE